MKPTPLFRSLQDRSALSAPRGAARAFLWIALFTLQAQAETPPTVRSSGAEDRKQVSITVYNQNFGLVRELRTLKELGAGRVSLEFRDVAANIQPETVHIKSLTRPGALRVLEQNYRYDLLTPETVIQKYVGKQVRAYRYHERLGKDEAVDAELLSAADPQRLVLKIHGEVTFDYPGRLAFPSVPENLIAKPTLVWLLESALPEQSVEATYLTQNLNWSADYVVVVSPDDTRADLTGWVTLVNQSGASYEDAELKLVAGDVHRVQREERLGYEFEGAPAKGAAPAFREEGLFEYHLYTLSRPTTVLHNEQKQVTLLEAVGARVEKKLIFHGQSHWFRGELGSPLTNQKVGVYLDIRNTEQNHLGIPLPKGTLRVYKADKSGAQQFVGEDAIDHTPRDEKVRVKLGEAFDVVAERKQMRWRALGQCISESDWELEFRNHKDTAVVVEDIEPVDGDWTIERSSLPATRRDARSFSFAVRVPARASTKLSYRVRVRWC